MPSPLVLETCQPDRPRSAVLAAKQIIMIVLNIGSTSKFNVMLKINETEDMNPTESAHILTKRLPLHGLISLQFSLLNCFARALSKLESLFIYMKILKKTK